MSTSFRECMSLEPGLAYFDHASVAPLTVAAHQAIVDWADDVGRFGSTHWNRWRTSVEKTRRLAARLINADREEIALIHSTTQGINLVAEGYPWKAGDNVVIPAGEFPSNLYPWLMLESQGVEVRRVPMPDHRIDLDKISDACDANTRIVTCSWVGYSHGFRVDLDQLADIVHKKGALLLVDAIQGLGVFPLDVKQSPIDFLSADGHKWLLGPEGAGIFYLKREHLDLLKPMGIGWNSVATAGEFQHECLDLRPTAARFEGGSFNMVGLAGLGASLEVMLDQGIERISNSLRDIVETATEQLRMIDAVVHSSSEHGQWSGIVSFDLPGQDSVSVKQKAKKQNVILNARNGHLRISPHAYTNQQDVEQLISVLKEM
ncbi:MAG: aminotransferase class V-fold PLP-dependent enzyme [Planctomycetaceae bacterium]|nr:aminotransferase class V-fold PLP-dependent enzyme [Planctomycetaceae bacterium]